MGHIRCSVADFEDSSGSLDHKRSTTTNVAVSSQNPPCDTYWQTPLTEPHFAVFSFATGAKPGGSTSPAKRGMECPTVCTAVSFALECALFFMSSTLQGFHGRRALGSKKRDCKTASASFALTAAVWRTSFASNFFGSFILARDCFNGANCGSRRWPRRPRALLHGNGRRNWLQAGCAACCAAGGGPHRVRGGSLPM